MNLTGEQNLPCSVERCWELLLDPEILKACIPGCEDLQQTGENAYSAVVLLKIGPIKARFNGEVELTDLNPPHTCRISGKGSGGIAGFAEGGAHVTLSPESGETTSLVYGVEAKVGGKIAQLGARLIDSTAQKLAKQFFDNLSREIEARNKTSGLESSS